MRHAHQMDQMQHSADVARHEVARLFREVSEDHLKAFAAVLCSISTTEEAGRPASYFHGLAVAALEARFNICWACNENHDEQLKGMSKVNEERDDNQFTGFGPGEPPVDLKIGENGLLSPRQIADMVEYNLDDVRDEETNNLLWFVCLLCEIQYQTIEDRKLKPADHCHGCFRKAAHG